MGRGRASAGVSGGLGCARPGHVRPTGGQSSERVGSESLGLGPSDALSVGLAISALSLIHI